MLRVLRFFVACASALRCHWNVDEGPNSHFSHNVPKGYNPPYYLPGPWGEPTSKHFSRDLYIYSETRLGLFPSPTVPWVGPGGFARMLMDPATNSSYVDWAANWETWMTRHLGRLPNDVRTNGKNGPTWDHVDTPSNWSGLAVIDYETVGAVWNRQL